MGRHSREQESTSGSSNVRDADARPVQRAPSAADGSKSARVTRLLVTPQFVIGAGVVLAAIAAYSTTETTLDFSSAHDNSLHCRKDCAAPSAGSRPRASAEDRNRPTSPGHVHPNLRRARPRPGGAGPAPGASATHPAARHAPQPTSGHIVALPTVRIGYHAVAAHRHGFIGDVAITNTGHRSLSRWRLRLHFSGARVHAAWGAILRRGGATPTFASPAYMPALRPGQTRYVHLVAGGSGATPVGCVFNGHACAIR